MTAAELLPLIALLDCLTEQIHRSGGAVPAELKVSWYALARRLLLGLRAEERAAARNDGELLGELKAIASNEHIRNLVWEVSLAVDLQSSRPNAMRQLAKLLRARAEETSELPSVQHPAA